MTATLPAETVMHRPDWAVCPRCRALIYGKRLARSLQVCPECDFHHRLSAPERMAQLLDPGSAQPLADPSNTSSNADPAGFTDLRPYHERLAEARARTGLDEAVLCARGRIEGHELVLAVMDFRFLGGSLGSQVGELISAAAETALELRLPLLIISASGGARMQEGALSLMQMARTSQALARLDQAGILTISLVTDPTYGGVAASFATGCDITIAEPGARLGFAGPRVIAQTIKQSLPKGFQEAESLLANGLIDLIQPRGGLRSLLGRLLDFAGQPATDPDAATGPDLVPSVLIREPSELADPAPWEAVCAARHLDRPTTLDYIGALLDGFVELHGDRMGADCPAIVAGIGRLRGRPVVVIGHQKGHRPAELVSRNFAMATPAGYRKSARLMRLAAKLSVPVLTLIDTPGAYPGVAAEAAGQAAAIADNLRLMSLLPVPTVALVTGEGGSGGALALALSNKVLMLAGAVYSVISPEGCAAILWNDPAAAPRAAAALRPLASNLLRSGVVDGVVPEPAGGAHCDPLTTTAAVRAALIEALAELARLTPEELVASRYERFRGLGRTGTAT